MSESKVTTSAIGEAEIAAILQHYRLGKLQDARRPRLGYVNDNWIVQTTAGTYFLKHRHPSLSQPAFIRCQHALVHWLLQAGFPAPRLLVHAGGDTLLTQGAECFEVQDYIEGRMYDHSRPQDLDEAAWTLGRYHQLVRAFPQASSCQRGDLYNPAMLRRNLDGLVQAWQLHQDAEAAPLLAQLAAQAQELSGRFATHGKLPRLVIHGDYYADNLLFSDQRIVGVVDYDKFCWQPRVVELAEVLIYFASPRPGQTKHLVYPGVLQWEPFRRVLNAYSRVQAVTPGEAQALPDYVHCIWLQMALQRLLEQGPRPCWAATALREVVELGQWAVDNADLIMTTGNLAAGETEAVRATLREA